MSPGTDSTSLTEVADRIVAAFNTVSRWAARDFKRTTGPAGLTPTQLGILVLVDRFGSLNASHLADRLGLSAPTIVRAVDALERKQLVARSRNATDQREVMIAATSEGRRMKSQVELARRDRLTRLMSRMSPDDVASLLIGYEALARVASEDLETTGTQGLGVEEAE